MDTRTKLKILDRLKDDEGFILNTLLRDRGLKLGVDSLPKIEMCNEKKIIFFNYIGWDFTESILN